MNRIEIIRGYLDDGMDLADLAGSETRHIRAAAEALHVGESACTGEQ